MKEPLEQRTQIGVRLRESELVALDAACADAMMSRSGMVRRTVAGWLRANGYLPEETSTSKETER